MGRSPSLPEPRHGEWRRRAREKQEFPPAVTFMDYRQARTVRTGENAVSTFSLDTDRTSYMLALNWARHGYPIHPDSVRAEEWVNSLDHGYVHPGGPEADSFHIQTDLGRPPSRTPG